MRLLLINADGDNAGPIMTGLRLRGHLVEQADNGLVAFSITPDNPYDAILVDQTLPYLAGVEVARHLRWRQIRQPIILFSIYDSAGHRQVAKEAGANALLVKPVVIDDIDAILTALHNAVGGLRQTIQCGDLEVDRGRRCATRNGRTIPLTRGQNRLLWALAERAGGIVRREELYDSVFRYSSGDLADTLSCMVAGLRKRLHAPGEPQLIETLRGVGYRLILCVDHSRLFTS